MDSNLFGCLAEYQFAVNAMLKGFSVCFPLLNSSPYDCIIETKKGFKKIQIKSVQKKSDKVRCYLMGTRKDIYSVDDVDFFAVYVEHHQGFYIFKNNGDRKSIVLSKNGVMSKNFNNFELL